MTRSVVVASLLLALCAASASAASKVGFYGCRTFVAKHPVAVVRPTSIVIACGDGNQYLTGVHWSSWATANAKGTGTLHYNDCTPNCAAGHFHTVRATVSLGKAASCKGARVFTSLHAMWPGGDSGQAFSCP
jgi:hypothetical protein